MVDLYEYKKCKGEFFSRDINESHNIPTYLFEGKDRNERRKEADKYGVTKLCWNCHKNYEKEVAMQVLFRIHNTLTTKQKEQARYIAKKIYEDYF